MFNELLLILFQALLQCLFSLDWKVTSNLAFGVDFKGYDYHKFVIDHLSLLANLSPIPWRLAVQFLSV